MLQRALTPRRLAVLVLVCAAALLVIVTAVVVAGDEVTNATAVAAAPVTTMSDSTITTGTTIVTATTRPVVVPTTTHAPATIATTTTAATVQTAPAAPEATRASATTDTAPPLTVATAPAIAPAEKALVLDMSVAAGDSGRNAAALAEQPATTTTGKPAFKSSIAAVEGQLKEDLIANKVWISGSPVGLDELRAITVDYWDLGGSVQSGTLIVNQAWAQQLCTVFGKLFDAHFPIRRMGPADYWRSGDDGVAEFDNTVGYTARQVGGGWSMHAYGLAIDINPVENPWVRSSSVTPALGAKYADRSLNDPAMVNEYVVAVFESIGWKWGGDWAGSNDYMHFSSNGR